ncbi:MAG TPA: hypothetical protein VEB21_17640 [Terriglobales bacterium]|nr:hypothetical protein [Terriglobales bacterium]
MVGDVFDSRPRTENRKAKRGESHFDYLNLSARKAAANVRDLVEAWLGHFPSRARAKLRTRLRSTDNVVFLPAFFELYCHEMLRQHGYLCEPDFPIEGAAGKNVDFKVHPPDGKPPFLLEAIVPGLSGPAAADRARIDAIYNAIDAKLDSPHFFIAIEEANAKPRVPIPVGTLCRQMEKQMARLNPDVFAAQPRGARRMSGPLWKATAAGWTVVYSLILKSPALRGRPGVRPIGSVARELNHEELLSTIRAAVRAKASRYGRPGIPYIVATNVVACRWALPSLDVADGKEALYGREIVVSSRDDPKPRLDRAKDGVFVGPKGPRHTRVSGAMLVSAITPWSVASQSPVLYHHPWAEHPAAGILERLPAVFPPPNRDLYREGCEGRELFELPEGWPE